MSYHLLSNTYFVLACQVILRRKQREKIDKDKGGVFLEEVLNVKISSYFGDMVGDLQELIRIKSVLEEEKCDERFPFGEGIDRALRFVLERGEAFGLKTKNLDGYAGYVEIGSGQDMVGVLAHIDVVPEGSGWSVDPYGGVILDGKLYGRGSIDDKGPTVAVLYALRAIEESKLPTAKRARLIIGTDEETGGRGLKYYLKKEEAPAYGFSPDATFPIIYAEKGILRFEFIKDIQDQKSTKAGEPVLKRISGGTRVNVVPDYSEAWLTNLTTDDVQSIIKKNRLEEKVQAEQVSEGILVKAYGVSAHAMQPREGINAIQLLLTILKDVDFKPHDAKRLIDFLSDKLDMQVNGEKIGLACRDDISGELTLNVGAIKFDDRFGSIKFDVRYPVTKDGNSIIKKLQQMADDMSARLIINQHKPPLYVDKDTELIKKLQLVYKQMTGQEPTLLAIGGGTYCRYVKNTVSFGPVFPGQKELAHRNNEYIGLPDLKKIAKIYGQAIYELMK